MLVSIIIPVYNLETYICRCLDSCLNQILIDEEFEIICVDDGSNDRSLEILNEYQENYSCIRVFKQIHEGASAARNKGIKVARGEYIWFVDGDDWIAENSLHIVQDEIRKLQFKPDSILFTSKMVSEDSDKNIVEREKYRVHYMEGMGSLEYSYDCNVWTRWFCDNQ